MHIAFFNKGCSLYPFPEHQPRAEIESHRYIYGGFLFAKIQRRPFIRCAPYCCTFPGWRFNVRN